MRNQPRNAVLSLSLFAVCCSALAVAPAYAQSKGQPKSSAARGDQVDQASPQTESQSCICDCVYTKSDRIRTHSYFEPSDGQSCSAIEGQGCLGSLRGDTFRGAIDQCQVAPRQIGTGATNFMTIREVGVRQTGRL